ncbi:hypothetical protein IGI04_020938 [Brassica rapa subsp. trilocularis]|uniref:Ribosomal protein S2 n=1 Tax=Brassica rapa subsp. trilocularis TaxID=1813537 RepID=A0ABQ7MK53_BRACM|nr:hypothetical protein IGI04_020938 [Brassica rapa subsp. trilocularis]
MSHRLHLLCFYVFLTSLILICNVRDQLIKPFIYCNNRDQETAKPFILFPSRRIQSDAYNHNRSTNLWKMRGFLTNSYSPKKFRSRHKKLCFGPTTMPDCVVVFDAERKSSVILEAAKLQVPVVAIVDPNVPLKFFDKITYPVLARDSVKFVM